MGTQRHYFWIFRLLTGLFLLRILAQLVQLLFNFPWLPSFETWQSGALQYKFLLPFQLLILLICFRIISKFRSRLPIPNKSWGRAFLALGSIYFITMTARIVLGVTIAKNHFWFNAPLPSFFHLILASIVLTLGYYHYKNANSPSV